MAPAAGLCVDFDNHARHAGTAAEFSQPIERTLRPCATVGRVRPAIDGDPRRFAERMGQDCNLRNDPGDPAPSSAGR